MRAVENSLRGMGWIAFVVVTLWGLFLCIGIIANAAGFWGIVTALLLAPITFLVAPLYSGFVLDDWFPLILNYGGGLVSMVLIGIGDTMSEARTK
jgi:hypothetical protein